MATQHDYYEGLCALAVSGQLAPDELRELTEHTQTCANCRQTLLDFSQIAAQVLPWAADKRKPVSPPPGMTERFIAKAHSEGIPLSKTAPPVNSKWFRRSAYLVAALFLLSLLLYKLGSNPKRYLAASNRTTVAVPGASPLTEKDDLQQQLEALKSKLTEVETQLQSSKRDLESVRSENLQTTARVAELQKTDDALRQELAVRDSQIAELNAQAVRSKTHTEQLVATQAAHEIQTQTSEAELKNLRDQVAILTGELNEKLQLTAAANEAKDLIVARNLHIIDVHDNALGSRPRPFGRIFYSEGQKLVFYAYDLADPHRVNSKVSFCVWGEKAGSSEQAKHMGFLQTDDQQDGRWVLTFNDPQVLAQINTVFVTAESNKKQVRQPSGNRILVAYLGGEPNHP